MGAVIPYGVVPNLIRKAQAISDSSGHEAAVAAIGYDLEHEHGYSANISKALALDLLNDFSAPLQILSKSAGERVIYGPASVAIRDREGDLISGPSLKAALPQLLLRARFSLQHTDILPGEILKEYEKDGVIYKTEVRPVTKEDLAAFPKLKSAGVQLGTHALFLVGKIYADNSFSDQVWEKVVKGELNSFSISGQAESASQKMDCNGFTCKLVKNITKVALSATTLCKEGMNQAASFVVLSKSMDEMLQKTCGCCDKCKAPACGCCDDCGDGGPQSFAKAADCEEVKTLEKNRKGVILGQYNVECAECSEKSIHYSEREANSAFERHERKTGHSLGNVGRYVVVPGQGYITAEGKIVHDKDKDYMKKTDCGCGCAGDCEGQTITKEKEDDSPATPEQVAALPPKPSKPMKAPGKVAPAAKKVVGAVAGGVKGAGKAAGKVAAAPVKVAARAIDEGEPNTESGARAKQATHQAISQVKGAMKKMTLETRLDRVIGTPITKMEDRLDELFEKARPGPDGRPSDSTEAKERKGTPAHIYGSSISAHPSVDASTTQPEKDEDEYNQPGGETRFERKPESTNGFYTKMSERLEKLNTQRLGREARHEDMKRGQSVVSASGGSTGPHKDRAQRALQGSRGKATAAHTAVGRATKKPETPDLAAAQVTGDVRKWYERLDAVLKANPVARKVDAEEGAEALDAFDREESEIREGRAWRKRDNEEREKRSDGGRGAKTLRNLEPYRKSLSDRIKAITKTTGQLCSCKGEGCKKCDYKGYVVKFDPMHETGRRGAKASIDERLAAIEHKEDKEEEKNPDIHKAGECITKELPPASACPNCRKYYKRDETSEVMNGNGKNGQKVEKAEDKGEDEAEDTVGEVEMKGDGKDEKADCHPGKEAVEIFRGRALCRDCANSGQMPLGKSFDHNSSAETHRHHFARITGSFEKEYTPHCTNCFEMMKTLERPTQYFGVFKEYRETGRIRDGALSFRDRQLFLKEMPLVKAKIGVGNKCKVCGTKLTEKDADTIEDAGNICRICYRMLAP